MTYFERNRDSLVFRSNGETVEICPWGKNSLRLRAVFMGDTIQIEYENHKGEILLREISPGGALHKTPRHFKNVSGDSFRVKQAFDATSDVTFHTHAK